MAEALDRRLLPDAEQPIVLGLSGGGDSLALLHLAKGWADGHGRRLLALTVDHGLDPESPHWTASAGEAAARAGVDWRALRWDGPKPGTGLPAAARGARHRLLANAAREAGASVILLGHTADDMAEAALMRERDAPSLGVLREWGPSPAWPEGRGVFLLRPLLGVSRAGLRAYLRERGLVWLDDPANDDPRYARARARQAIGRGGAATLVLRQPRDEDCCSAGSRPHPELVDGRGRSPRGWSVSTDGRILAKPGALSPRFVSAALLCAGGGDEPPRGPRLERLVERLKEGERVVATLAGARVTGGDGCIAFGREAGERARGGLAPLEVSPGAPVVWDGRFEIAADAPVLVGPLAGRIAALSRPERAWLKTLPAAARSALPVLTLEGGAVVLPRPFGRGPAEARSLVEDRLAAAIGLMERETIRPS